MTQSVVVYLRRDGAGSPPAVVVLNFAAVARFSYRVGVPLPGFYREVLNSDARCYGGDGSAVDGVLRTGPVFHMGQPFSLVVDLPPLAGKVFVPCGEASGDN